jgi:hypothetical protein
MPVAIAQAFFKVASLVLALMIQKIWQQLLKTK